MKQIIISLAFFLIGFLSYAQEIVLLRTDVDTSRKSFVTATYNFSFKVKLLNVQNCTSVSFVLRHNQTDYIKFSNYRTLSFSKTGSVFVYPYFNPLDRHTRIYTGILNGDTIGGKGENNPEVIEFEFSVAPDAPENSVVEFFFEDAEAVVTENDVGKIIKLRFLPILYNIHGFVEVWPGDANNDGTVNINDVSAVALYLGYGSNKVNFRSFQRVKASTNWFAQTCLAWDSLAITYADCDGDGEVTINDMLVIPLNFGKTHQLKNTVIPENFFSNLVEQNEICFTAYPFSILADEPIIGFVGNLEPSQLFTINKEDISILNKNSDFFIINFSNENSKYIFCASKTNEPLNGKLIVVSNQNQVVSGSGITNDGRIILAKLIPISVANITSDFGSNYLNVIEQLEFPSKIQIFNYLGEKINLNEILSKNEFENTINKLPNGIYFFKIRSFDKHFFWKYLHNN